MHIMKKQVLLIILLALPLWLKAADVSVTGLRTEQMVDPMGLDTAAPRMSWRLESSQRNVMQTAYRILVASSPELLAQDKGDLWDSGKVESDASVWIPYQGKRLKSNQRVYWKVRSYTNRGETEWSEPVNIRPGAGWIDPCPFWDDDGNAYLVAGVAKSRIGYKSVLHIVRMRPDGMGIFGDEVKIFDGNENDQITIEGPKMYKRNGYYYIFAPAGGVKTGWQTILRSKNPFGPYEYKVVLRQGDSLVNGPHQGAWVDTITGEDWFLHFQDVYAGGRIVHLQPMHWENDWPVIGVNKPGNDYGEPVMEYKKPDIGKSEAELADKNLYPCLLYTSDAADEL